MIQVLLLLALPASGKSEIRRYLESLGSEERLEAFGLGSLVQLDDFPYVHMMRRVSEEARTVGVDPPFFAGDGPFLDKRDWGTLIHLLNQDYEALRTPFTIDPDPAAWILNRMADARRAVGADPWIDRVEPEALLRVQRAIAPEAQALFDEAVVRRMDDGDTILIEFARGVAVGAALPASPPHGYRYSLSQLSPEILERASILYVRVTPEESRRRNRERAVPGGEASILDHGVSERVMLEDYGRDDFSWLMAQSGSSEFIEVVTGRGTHRVPASVFDNDGDYTSFLRQDPGSWSQRQLADLRARLEQAFAPLTS